MDANSSNSSDRILDQSNSSLQEDTIVGDANGFDDSDLTLTLDDSSLPVISISDESNTSETNLQSNTNLKSEDNLSTFEIELNKHANNIVDEAIDSASLSFCSSGDFSLLKDSEELENKTETVDNDEKVNEDSSSQNHKISVEETAKLEEKTAEEEKGDAWLDILGNGLLKKKILEPGQGESSRPQRGQEVTINMTIFTEEGDNLETTKTMSFIVADFDVAEGIDMAVNLMEKGEKCRVESDARYCQPKDGQLSNIPKEGKVVFHIELIAVEEGPYNTSVSIEKRLHWVDMKRKTGNDLYKQNKHEEAKLAYSKCTRVLRQALNQEHSDEVKLQIENYTMKCHNNLAAALIKLRNWNDALQACHIAEKYDANNIKTLFRKGTIFAKLGQYKQSIGALKKAVSLSPDDKTIQNELSKQQKRLEFQNKAQKEMYQRMFGSTNKTNEQKPEDNKKSWFSSSGVLLGGSLAVLGTAILFGVYMMHR